MEVKKRNEPQRTVHHGITLLTGVFVPRIEEFEANANKRGMDLRSLRTTTIPKQSPCLFRLDVFYLFAPGHCFALKDRASYNWHGHLRKRREPTGKAMGKLCLPLPV